MRSFEEIRHLGLAVLRPSARELEYGLELHKRLMVFDAYGFIPLGGYKLTERLKGLIEKNASRDEIFWELEKMCMGDAFDDQQIVSRFKEAVELSGVNCLFQNSGVEGNNGMEMLKRLGLYNNLADRFPEILERAPFPDRIETIRSANKLALYPTTNGVPLPEHITSTQEALNWIEVFFNLGVRMMHFTYNRRNLLGDGCAEIADAGISEFGQQAIEEMNRVGIICDLAHSGQQTTITAAKFSKKPVVVSHSAAHKLSGHYRGKCDEAIEAVKQSGGYVGICAHPPFLGGSKMIDALLDHVDYIAKKFGVDHVAIGTDHSTMLDCDDEINCPPFRPIQEQYWRKNDGSFDMTQEQYDSMAWVNWPLFTVGLVQRGYKDDEIAKIVGGNVMRVCQEVLAV